MFDLRDYQMYWIGKHIANVVFMICLVYLAISKLSNWKRKR